MQELQEQKQVLQRALPIKGKNKLHASYTSVKAVSLWTINTLASFPTWP